MGAWAMSTIDEELALGPELAGALMTPEEFDAVTDLDQAVRHVTAVINGGGATIDIVNVNGGVRIEGD